MDDKRISRIEDKIDIISERLSSIDSTIYAQHISLKEHMRRTDLLEKSLDPVQKHVIMIQGGIKLLAGLVIAVGVISSIISIIQSL